MTSSRVTAALFSLLLSAAASAANRSWVGPSSGVWSDPNNWSPAGAPVSGETVIFPAMVLALTNDIDGLSLAGLLGGGPAGSTLDGKPLTITGDTSLPGWIVNVDITLEAASARVGEGDFRGAFNVSGATVQFPSGYGFTVIRGPLTGSGTLVNSIRIAHDGTFSGVATGGFIGIDGAALPGLDVKDAILMGHGTVGAVASEVFPSDLSSSYYSDHTLATLSMASLWLSSRYSVDVDASAGASDQLIVAGDVTLSGPLSLSIIGPAPAVGQSFVIIDHAGTAPVSGSFSYLNSTGLSLTEGTVFSLSGAYFRITYRGGDGNDVVLEVVEPPAGTSTVVSLSPDSILSGEQVTFTANVSYLDGTPAPSGGMVRFFLAPNSPLRDVTIVNGVATFTTTIANYGTRTYPVTAAYAGSGNALASESSPVPLTVHSVPVTIEVHTSPNPSAAADPVRLYVTLTNGDDASASVSGTIRVLSGTAPEGYLPIIAVRSGTFSGPVEIDLTGLRAGNYSFAILYEPTVPFDRADLQGTSHTISAPVITIDDVSVQEGNDQDTRVLIPLHLTAPPETGHSATVNYRTIAGTATAGEDYVATSGIASISSGTEGTIEVLIHGDRKREPNETFTIEISSAFYASIGRSSATVTIVDDDANALAPTTTTLALSNASITYGETIRLSAAATPASAGMPAPSGAVTFAADGHSIGTVALTNGAAAMETDVLPAGSHSFTASYGGDTTNDVSTSVPLIAIVAKAGTSVAYSSTPKVSAGDPVTIRAEVRRDEQAEQRATGSVSVSDAGHILAEQSVSHGAATLTIVGLASGSHQLLITYSGDGNLTPSSVMMSEEVALPVLSISVTSVAEGNAGVSTPVMLTVALSAPSTEVVRVAFGTIDGTARTGEDYEPVHGIVEFAPGEMMKRVEVDVIGDNVPEADETFFLVLSDPRNATIDVPSAIVVIANDDQVPPRRRPSRH